MRICIKCHQECPEPRFKTQNPIRIGLCSSCGRKAVAKAYRESEEGKLWRKRWEESERGRKIVQARRQSEEYKAWMKQWRETEAGKASEARSGHKRRMLERESVAVLTLEEWEDIKKHYKYRCVYCGEKKPLTRDHVVPVSKGGAFTKDNVVPACKSCNSVKRDKPVLLQLLVDSTYSKSQIDDSPPKTTRICTKCKRDLPFSSFGHRKYNNVLALRSHCRECERITAAQHRQTDEYKDKIVEYRASEEYKKRRLDYRLSEKGKAVRSAYWKSDISKAKVKVYQHSEKGIAAIKRSEQKRNIRKQYHRSGIFCIAM